MKSVPGAVMQGKAPVPVSSLPLVGGIQGGGRREATTKTLRKY